MVIRELTVLDLRFPTSRTHAGTDAVHVDPDYSAAYVVLKTDAGLEGHGLTFTIGRGNEVVVAAIDAFRHLVVGERLDAIASDFAGFWRRLASDSQLRWLDRKRASSISRWPPSSTRSGTSTPKPSKNRFGSCCPTCHPSRSWRLCHSDT